jgi:hypothetical protein
MSANREHKDSVFTKLFSAPEELIKLYNAVGGGSYGLDAKIEINTLEDVLFNEQLNDISFTIDDKLVVLFEHQSTINANMPLRFLIYIARVYEKLLEPRVVYRQRIVKIPTPEFYVLYNGRERLPEEETLRLSTAFMERTGVPSLELTVRILNINQGYNEGIVKKSDTLNGYITFIAKVRENQDKGMELTEAITEAVKYCTGKHILQKFLTEHSKEVLNMLTTEFNLKDAQEVWLEEGREEGIEIGIERGIERGIEKGREEGVEKVLLLLKSGYLPEEIEQILKEEHQKHGG